MPEDLACTAYASPRNNPISSERMIAMRVACWKVKSLPLGASQPSSRSLPGKESNRSLRALSDTNSRGSVAPALTSGQRKWS